MILVHQFGELEHAGRTAVVQKGQVADQFHVERDTGPRQDQREEARA